MRSIHLHSIFFAAALAAATLAACSNEDNAVVESQHDNEILFTATLAPKGGGGDGATRSVDANGKTAWVTGEKIAIYYETNDNGHATVDAEVTANTTDGTATISATLTNVKSSATTVKLVYPATLNKDGEINISKLRTKQVGILTDDNEETMDISHHFDAATAEVPLNFVSATENPITMKNEVCICKFSFIGLQPNDNDENLYNITITVTEGGTPRSYMINNVPAANTSALYMAMLPTTNADFQFVVEGGKTDNGTFTVVKQYGASYSGVTLAAGNFYTNVPITVGPIIYKSGIIHEKVIVPDGQTLILNNATINASSGPGIVCNGDATIILMGTNTVNAGGSNAGIRASSSKTTLTISGSGKLTANGGSDSAGIGSNSGTTCGNIIINGGTVEATGGANAAGIGSNSGTTCGNIIINGGTVEATGGANAAGIGTGLNGYCGDITISGGTVTATKGTNAACSIGKGGGSSTCGTITIGGTMYFDGVTASPFTWPEVNGF